MSRTSYRQRVLEQLLIRHRAASAVLAFLITGLLIGIALPAWAVQEARPDKDVSNPGDWSETTPDGNTFRFDELDEAVRDGTRTQVFSPDVSVATSGASFSVRLSAIADPQTSSGHTLKIWAKREDVSGADIKVRTALRRPSGTLIADFVTPVLTATYQEHKYTLTAVEADGISTTDYAGLRMQFTAMGSGSQKGRSAFITRAGFEVPDTSSPPSPQQCEDQVDNDGDGRVDYPADPGCADASDDTENPDPPQCSDGIDNDDDGKADYVNDPGCESSTDDSESPDPPPPLMQCQDTLDNDGDGTTDFPSDLGCESLLDDSESSESSSAACADGVDNDGDGAVDHPTDPGCDDALDRSEEDPSNCPTAAVDVFPSDSLPDKVNASPGGTTFCIKDGIHVLSQHVESKADNKYIGDYFDGTRPSVMAINQTRNVFRAAPNNYFRGLEISGAYATSACADSGCGRGIRAAHNLEVANSILHSNMTSGVGGGDSDNVFIHDSEFYNNGSNVSNGCCSAGIKLLRTFRAVDNNIHHNDGQAIWCDQGCLASSNQPSTVIQRNTISGNNGGVLLECSLSPAEVSGNTFTGPSRAVGVINSKTATVHDNVIRDVNPSIPGIKFNENRVGDPTRCAGFAVHLQDDEAYANTMNGASIAGCDHEHLPDGKPDVWCHDNIN